MRFAAWMKSEGLYDAQAARELGVSAETVRRLQLATDHPEYQVPKRPLMKRIFVRSRGQVQPNDFYDLPPAKAGRAVRRRSGRG